MSEQRKLRIWKRYGDGNEITDLFLVTTDCEVIMKISLLIYPREDLTFNQIKEIILKNVKTPKEFCRESKNFVFWFGMQFNLTLNFTQSGWFILFSPDLSFPANRWVKLPNTCSLAVERRPVQTSHCGSRIAAAWTHVGKHLIYGFLTRNPSWI